MIHDERFTCNNAPLSVLPILNNIESVRKTNTIATVLKKSFLYSILVLSAAHGLASCPDTIPWSSPVNLSASGCVASGVFSAATSAGFMIVWADDSNNAHYSFSKNGTTWLSGLIPAAQGNIASNSDVFVAGNATGFIVTWMDNSNNAWSSFSANNGQSWSDAIQINPNTLALNSNSDTYVGGSSEGFVATMVGADNNAYVSFSTGTQAWSTPTQVTTDGSVQLIDRDSKTGRGFVSVVVVGNSCMLAWITNPDSTNSAYFSTINPFSSTTVYPIVNVGFFENSPILAALNSYFMATSQANVVNGAAYFSVATIPSNWATFSLFLTPNTVPNSGPWLAANNTGFMSAWVIGSDTDAPGSPVWTFSNNNGFNWTPVCSILATPSTTISGQIGLSGNYQGFVATWLDSNDYNAYVSFYPTASSSATDIFVTLLQQKYGPLL